VATADPGNAGVPLDLLLDLAFLTFALFLDSNLLQVVGC
jgi:hypothetical protein